MKQHIYQFKVETEDELIVISQENSTHENGEDAVVLNPCQIDLLISILNSAKREFANSSAIEVKK